MQFDGFDWDDGNWPKCGKHGVTQEEIEGAFDRSDMIVLVDAAHGIGEDRFLMVVLGFGGHHGLLVGFTWRQRGELKLIRPVTARFMHRKEVKFYEH